MTVCKFCGCKEDKACSGGCYWVSIDKSRRHGVCSNCAISTKEANKFTKCLISDPIYDELRIIGMKRGKIVNQWLVVKTQEQTKKKVKKK